MCRSVCCFCCLLSCRQDHKTCNWHHFSRDSQFLLRNNIQEDYSLVKYMWSLWLALLSTVLDTISSLQWENCRFPPSLQLICQIPLNMAPLVLKFKKSEICRTYSVSLEHVVSWQQQLCCTAHMSQGLDVYETHENRCCIFLCTASFYINCIVPKTPTQK